MPHEVSSLRRAALAALIALAALSLPAAAGAASRESDQQIADKSVLTIRDVPAGFEQATANDAPDEAPGAACAAIRAAALALDTAPHTEVEFQTSGGNAGGALINNQVSVFATPKRAKVTYAPYAAKDAKNCLTTEYERAFLIQINDPSAKIRVTARRYHPDLGDASTGYKVRIDASVKGDSQTYYVDVEVARLGRAVNAFGFFNSGSAPPSNDVVTMTDAGMTRLEKQLAS